MFITCFLLDRNNIYTTNNEHFENWCGPCNLVRNYTVFLSSDVLSYVQLIGYSVMMLSMHGMLSCWLLTTTGYYAWHTQRRNKHVSMLLSGIWQLYYISRYENINWIRNTMFRMPLWFILIFVIFKLLVEYFPLFFCFGRTIVIIELIWWNHQPLIIE